MGQARGIHDIGQEIVNIGAGWMAAQDLHLAATQGRRVNGLEGIGTKMPDQVLHAPRQGSLAVREGGDHPQAAARGAQRSDPLDSAGDGRQGRETGLRPIIETTDQPSGLPSVKAKPGRHVETAWTRRIGVQTLLCEEGLESLQEVEQDIVAIEQNERRYGLADR